MNATHSPTVPASAADLEEKTLRKLRSSSGWWVGDPAARRVLREYAEAIRAERCEIIETNSANSTTHEHHQNAA